jgi:hypothetical protein
VTDGDDLVTTIDSGDYNRYAVDEVLESQTDEHN